MSLPPAALNISRLLGNHLFFLFGINVAAAAAVFWAAHFEALLAIFSLSLHTHTHISMWRTTPTPIGQLPDLSMFSKRRLTDGLPSSVDYLQLLLNSVHFVFLFPCPLSLVDCIDILLLLCTGAKYCSCESISKNRVLYVLNASLRFVYRHFLFTTKTVRGCWDLA